MKARKFGVFLLIFFAIAAIVPMVVISNPGTYWRNFRLSAPDEIGAKPGDTVVINATILNTGKWWLRDFNITLQGLPSGYNYTVTPSHWDEVKILWDWNTKDGLFRDQEPFLIAIKVPADASGLHAVTVNGTEHASVWQVSNTTQFVLKITGEPAKPQISGLSVPDVINSNQSFDVSYKITNSGAGEIAAAAKLLVPENWSADPASRSISLKENESIVVNFSVIPSQNSGAIIADVEYPFENQTYNVTSSSGTLIPMQTNVPSTGGLDLGLSGLFASLQNYSPLLITIVVVIILVIGWIVWSVYGMVGKKKKPETMKKQVEVNSLPQAF